MNYTCKATKILHDIRNTYIPHTHHVFNSNKFHNFNTWDQNSLHLNTNMQLHLHALHMLYFSVNAQWTTFYHVLLCQAQQSVKSAFNTKVTNLKIFETHFL